MVSTHADLLVEPPVYAHAHVFDPVGFNAVGSVALSWSNLKDSNNKNDLNDLYRHTFDKCDCKLGSVKARIEILPTRFNRVGRISIPVFIL